MSAAPKKGLYGEIKPRKAEFTLSEVNVPSPVAGRAESPEPVPSEPLGACPDPERSEGEWGDEGKQSPSSPRSNTQ